MEENENKTMQLNDPRETISLMASDNYKDRFVAEYWQHRIRLQRLKVICEKWDAGELKFTPTCPREVLDKQIALMDDLQILLEQRAEIEGVDLSRPQSNINFINGFKNACDTLAGLTYKLPPCRNTSMMATKIVEASLWADHELDRRQTK